MTYVDLYLAMCSPTYPRPPSPPHPPALVLCGGEHVVYSNKVVKKFIYKGFIVFAPFVLALNKCLLYGD